MPGLELPSGQLIDLEGNRRRRLIRWVVVGAGVIGTLALGFHLSEVFNPLMIGLLIAYMLNPLVEWAEARGWSRERFVTGLFVVVFLVMATVLGVGTVKLIGQVEHLGQSLTGERLLDESDEEDLALIQAARTLQSGGQLDPSRVPPRIASVVHSDAGWFVDHNTDRKRDPGVIERVVTMAYRQLGDSVSQSDLRRLGASARAHASSLTKAGSQLTDWLKDVAGTAGTFLQYLLLIPLYTFFLLNSFSKLREAIRDHLPGEYRGRIIQISRRIDRQVAAFFRGKLTLALGKGVVTWLGFWMAGVPFSLPIGLLAGLLSVVPFAGPICGGALAIMVTFSPEGWLLKILLVVVVLGAAEAFEAVAQPLILGREVGLSPLTLILSFFVFGNLFGLFGVLLAVPIACATKILLVELVLPEIKALAQERGPPVPPVTQVFRAATLSEEDPLPPPSAGGA